MTEDFSFMIVNSGTGEQIAPEITRGQFRATGTPNEVAEQIAAMWAPKLTVSTWEIHVWNGAGNWWTPVIAPGLFRSLDLSTIMATAVAGK